MTKRNTPDYRIARQAHVGAQLDELQSIGKLKWYWRYEGRTAEYWVRLIGQDAPVRYGTREAEQLVGGICADLGILWLPVPHPGGKEQLEQTLARMGELSRGTAE